MGLGVLDPPGATVAASAPATPPRTRYGWWVAAAIGVGLCLRLALAVGDDVITNDTTAYLRSGASIWDGEGFRRDGTPELHFTPAYPFILGGVERLVDDPHTAMVLTTLVASTLALLPLASIGRRVGGDRTGIATAWIGALAAGLVDVPVTGGSGNEVVYLLLVLLALRMALLAADRTGWRAAVAAGGAGVLVGAAYLTRPEGLFFAPLLVAVVVVPAWRQRGSRRSSAVAALALVAGVTVMAAPYVAYLHDHVGRWALTDKTTDASIEAWQAVADHDRPARDAVIYELDETGFAFRAERSSLFELAREDPRGYAGILGSNVTQLWDSVAVPVDRERPSLGWALLPLPVSLLAGWAVWRHRRQWTTWVMVAAAAIPTSSALLFFVQNRYLIPATAMVCVLAGLGVACLPPARTRWVVPIVAGLLGLSLVAAFDGDDGWANRREPVEHRLVGEWLAANTPPKARVMTRSMIVEYYSQRRAVAVPDAEIGDVLRFAEHHDVAYLVIDEYNMRELRPQLLPLLDDPSPAGLHVAYELEYSGRRLRVLAFDSVPATRPGEDAPGLGFMGDG